MFAIIKTGGKQYVVTPDKKLKIEKIASTEDKKVVFDKVLLFSDGGKVEIGKPYLKGIKVEAELIEEGRDKKVIVFKYKAKKRYKKKKGHRQPFSEVIIKSIS